MRASVAPTRPRLSRGAITALLLLLGAAFLAPMLSYPFGSDHGVFATAADAISHGRVPYRDVWENKPPAVDYLFWAGFHLFGRSMAAIRFLDLLWTLATAAALVAIGRRLLSPWTAVAGAVLFLARYALGYDYWNTAQCDGFASLPLTLAVLLALLAESRHSRLLALASGALLGLAITFKFTVGGLLVVPFLFALISRQDRLASRLLRAACYPLAAAAVLGLAVLLLWHAGALSQMYASVFAWNVAYGKIQPPAPLLLVISYQLGQLLFGGKHLVLQLIGVFSLLGLVDLVRRRRALPSWWFTPAWLVLMLVGVIAQAKYYAYHWLPVLPPLGLLAGEGLRLVFALASRPRLATARKACLTAVVALLAMALAHGWWTQFRDPVRYLSGRLPADQYDAEFTSAGGYFSFTADQAVADYIRGNTQPQDPIFVWGLEPLVYFLADRPPATRFTYPIALMAPWSPPELKAQALADLRVSRPKLLLVVHNDAQPWATGWRGDSFSYVGVWPDLRALITTHYHPVGRLEDFDIWQRRSE